MTNKMLEDLIKVLKKKITILTVVCVVLALACVGLIVFVTCEYEVVYEEYEETIDYEITQDTGNGSGDNVAIIGSDLLWIYGTAQTKQQTYSGLWNSHSYGKSDRNIAFFVDKYDI